MNKVILIALIAVCVASSVQAAVKRDAPTPPAEDNIIEKMKETLTHIGDDIKKSLNPDEISKKFSEAMDTVSKGFEDFKKKIETKPEDAKP